MNNLINETIINIYYKHYYLHIIHKRIKPHENQDFLCGNLVTGEKTTEAFTNFRISFARIKYWLGQSTP